MSLFRSSLAPLGYVKVRSIRLLGLVLILFCLDRHVPYLRWRVPSLLTDWILKKGIFFFSLYSTLLHLPLSYSTVLEDAWIEPRTQVISYLSGAKASYEVELKST
jgi:hypothetical protein